MNFHILLALFHVLRLYLPVATKVTVELKSSQLASNYIAESLYRWLIIMHVEFCLSMSVCS